jgi:hypothetical protein
MGKAALDIDGYRERVAGAVGMAVSELVGSNRDDPRAAMLRMIAAYFLLQRDRLPVGDVARIMDRTESWVRESTAYIERRVSHYYAFRVYIEKTMATYALASKGGIGGQISGSRRPLTVWQANAHVHRIRRGGGVRW